MDQSCIRVVHTMLGEGILDGENYKHRGMGASDSVGLWESCK